MDTETRMVVIHYPEIKDATDIRGQVIEGNTYDIEVGGSIEVQMSVARRLKRTFKFLKINEVSAEEKESEPMLGADVSDKGITKAQLEVEKDKSEPTEDDEEEIEIDPEELDTMPRPELMKIAAAMGIKHTLKNETLREEIRKQLD